MLALALMSHVGEAQMLSIMILSPLLLMIKKQMKFNSFYFNTSSLVPYRLVVDMRGPQGLKVYKRHSGMGATNLKFWAPI